jgi:capsular exopolysaccharide synthesis family protein
MTNLISDMIDLIHERAAITNTNEKNVFLTQTENKIRTQKQLIIDHATNSLNTSTITLNDLNNRYQRFRMEIARLPRQEMNMVNFQRKYDLNSEQYSYLLQKRSEASMTLASTYPDFEVLEPAREITSKKIKPKSKINYLLSIFLGALLPSIFLIIRSFFTSKIVGTDSIEHLADRAVFGVIYNNPRKSEAVVTESPRSAISESFRNLRSSLFLKLGSEKSKVIQITSAQPRDGKSFVSYNLACSIASVELKTVIIDCDLRCPVLHDKFFVENARGISDYMIKRARVDDIIQKTSVRNLFFIPAGNVIPNPSELISSGVLDDLFTLLKERFEFIIVDTPPLGIVSDTIQLTKYSSQILLITRNNLTEKDALINVLAVLDLNKINNFEIVLNDMEYAKSPYSGYTNYYHKE